MRKPTPLHIIAAQARRKPLHERVIFLRESVADELPYSVRKNELQSLLAGALHRLLRKEIRVGKAA